MDYSSYASILMTDGTTKRDRVISKARHDTNILAPDSPAYKTVEIDGNQRNMVIISSTVTNSKIIQSMPGDDFEIGQIMVWSKSHWLITERDADDEITVRGKIELCNRSIQWQNDESKQIVSRWGVVDKPYFSNLSENNVMTLSSREFRIKIPYDAESSLLDIGKRLMLEEINGRPKTYRITCVDAMTERYDRDNKQTGFLTINVEQDQYDAGTDSQQHMICDYEPPHEIEEGAVRIVFDGDPRVKIGGRGKVFKAAMADNAYVENCTWTLTMDDTLTGKVYFDSKDRSEAVTCSGAFCRVRTDGDVAMNGMHVTLEVETPDNGKDKIEVEVADS